ncbi:MAG: ABC transporter ATP-binding protein [Anaerovoracaceae bacterium]
MPLLTVNDLKKTYTTRFGGSKVEALRGVSFSVEQGEFTAIMGESGSGKTTLLNILASLDRPTSGEVLLSGRDITKISDKGISVFRRDHLGFIFQDFNLLNTLSVKDNIMLPLILKRSDVKEAEKKAGALAGKLGISNIMEKYPYEVSGGQKQRAAAARALITEPEILLADEPTGALDSHSADVLMDLLAEINGEGQTIIMVTHSTKAASYAGRVLFIRDGRIFHQLIRGGSTNEQLFAAIADTQTILAGGGERHA